MAAQLIREMTGAWHPETYADRFTEAIHALAAQRVEAGQTARVEPLEGEAGPPAASNVVDLTELLKRSLGARKPGAADAAAAPAPSAARGTKAVTTTPSPAATSAPTPAAKAPAKAPARKAARKRAA